MAERRAPSVLRLPRSLHPGAWWLWAFGMATAASRTTNPLLLAAVVAVVALVVSNRRGEAPWARGFRFYLVLALVVVAIRVAFRALLGGGDGGTTLFHLPEVHLPATVGFRFGGAVSAEALLAAVYDGLRLATLLVCLGAANVLANPKRLLKAAPAALHEIGVSVTVALSVAPQLIESAMRIRRARKLRGGVRRGRRAIRGILLPVLEDALERSIRLAAAMDTRGYGRRSHVRPGARRATAALVVTGTLGIAVGTYASLDATAPRVLAAPTLLVGLAVAVVGTTLAGRQIRRTVYRPDPWRGPEWAVAGVGGVVAVGIAATAGLDPAGMYPSVDPLVWPHLPAATTGVLLLGALPAWLAPPVSTGSDRDPRGARTAALDGTTARGDVVGTTPAPAPAPTPPAEVPR